MKSNKKAIVALTLAGLGGLYVVGRITEQIPAIHKLVFGKSIDGLVNNFPGTIPNVESIEKYLVPDSRYLLVYVRQKHSVDSFAENKDIVETMRKELSGLDEGVRKEFIDAYLRLVHSEGLVMAFRTQIDIVTILDFLLKYFSLKDVYKEGLTVEDEPNFNRARETYREGLKQLEYFEPQAEFSRHQSSELEAMLSNRASEKEPREELSKRKEFLAAYEKLKKESDDMKKKAVEDLGAVGPMFLDGIIDLRPVERKELQSRAKRLLYESIVDKAKEEEAERLVHDERERTSLELIVNGLEESDREVAILVYGGAHNFRERIEKEWNLNQRNKKFSVITITPASYDKESNVVYPWEKEKK